MTVRMLFNEITTIDNLPSTESKNDPVDLIKRRRRNSYFNKSNSASLETYIVFEVMLLRLVILLT